jgi:hypothetical protein
VQKQTFGSEWVAIRDSRFIRPVALAVHAARGLREPATYTVTAFGAGVHDSAQARVGTHVHRPDHMKHIELMLNAQVYDKPVYFVC